MKDWLRKLFATKVAKPQPQLKYVGRHYVRDHVNPALLPPCCQSYDEPEVDYVRSPPDKPGYVEVKLEKLIPPVTVKTAVFRAYKKFRAHVKAATGREYGPCPDRDWENVVERALEASKTDKT